MDRIKRYVKSLITVLFFYGIFISVSFVIFTRPALADMGIYCPLCKKHLYDYKGEVVSGKVIMASDFIPTEGVPQPKDTDRIICPFDSAPLNGWEYWFWSRQREQPTFAYQAVTLLTKENGEFKWVPEEVLMDEDIKR